MEEYLNILKQSPLFAEMEGEEICSVLQCLAARKKAYKKGSFLFHAGDAIREIGFVLEGTVTVLKEDCWGNRAILSQAGAGQLFAEVYACLPGEAAQVGALASEDACILFLNVQKMLHTCSSSCPFHTRLIQNLLSVIACKTLELTKKIEHLSKRTTREKLLSYLSAQAQAAASSQFTIPFTRQQLADYLIVDRSAMSHELCRLRDDGILLFRKNQFTLLKQLDGFHEPCTACHNKIKHFPAGK